MNTTAPFYIVPPQEQLVDRNGFITRSWWRFFSSLFANSGGGNTPPAAEVADLAFLNAVQSNDSDATAARIEPLLFLPAATGGVEALRQRVEALERIVDTAAAGLGRIAALEARVEYLTRLVVEQGTARSLAPPPSWDAVQIYSLGGH